MFSSLAPRVRSRSARREGALSGLASPGTVLLVALALALPSPALGQERDPASVTWIGNAESVSVSFNFDVLRDLGVELLDPRTTAVSVRPETDSLGFAARADQSLRFAATGGSFEGLTDGTVAFEGGFDLAFPDGSQVSLRGFALKALSGGRPFELLGTDGAGVFYLDFAHAWVRPELERLEMRNMDLRLSQASAERLGRPGLTGLAVGQVDFLARAPVPAGVEIGDGGCSVTGGDVDVALTALDDLSQMAREAGVRVALALSASVRNVGQATVEWYRAITPDGQVGAHPYLVMHIYRLKDGRFEQIGRSDVKHAFFAVNSGCGCPGGHLFYANCGDIYGTGSNSNRTHFGPRDEVNSVTGAWTSLGSHFDAVPVNDFRDHGGNSAHDSFEHRLVVAEPDLQDGSARFFAEAWYLAAGDINIFNSMGRREFEPKLEGSFWDFLFLDATMLSGAAIDAWPAAEGPGAASTDEPFNAAGGQGRLSIRVEPQPDGGFRYEIGLMNFDVNAGLDELRIPLPDDITVSDLTFFDGDDDPANDWTPVVAPTELRWQAGSGEEQGWGTLFSFGFYAESRPQAVTAQVGVVGASDLAVAGLAPSPAEIFSGDFEDGTTGGWSSASP